MIGRGKARVEKASILATSELELGAIVTTIPLLSSNRTMWGIGPDPRRHNFRIIWAAAIGSGGTINFLALFISELGRSSSGS
jgi:hypothetical protein